MPDCSGAKTENLSDLLTSKETNEKIRTVDVVLDCFWALMTECSTTNSADLPVNLREFKEICKIAAVSDCC